MTVRQAIGAAGALAALLCSLAMGPASAPAATGALSHSPTEVVKRYLSLDQKGARLDSLSFDTIAPYIAWRDEPAWGRVVVIQEFVVPEDYRQWDIVNQLEVVIPVRVRVLGSVYLETAGFVPGDESVEIRFRVKAIKNRWRIVEPMLPPHVGQRRMVSFVRQALIQETEPSKRSSLAALVEDLRKAK